ncbi:YolD-like family protein [Paenibacillus aurantius]|uniref:YolD-like family protein n=1 Tax=Paenibacillus aurantius TaxID=2918900 RepID=A0AA96LIM0_9BACL|nr:YolD-like family protein [Paenibacillus aurantius]WNQ13683.1 YolD-like family protein [Paenibacillus aurantius]
MGRKLEGNGIWEASRMMLPEHREQIIRHRGDLPKKAKPALDEQRIQELSDLLAEAVNRGKAVQLTLYDPISPSILHGRIERVDPLLGRVRVTAGEEEWRVPLRDILDIVLE